MRQDAGDGPGHDRMVGSKGCAVLKKMTESLILVGALSSKGVLEYCVHAHTIDRRFSGQNAGFPLVVVVRNLAPNIQTAAHANQRVHSVVGKTRVTIDFIGIS